MAAAVVLFIVGGLLSPFLVSCAVSKDSNAMMLTPTVYYKPTIKQADSKCSSNELRELFSPEGVSLATLCEADYKECLLQGSCFFNDGEKTVSYNYHSTKDEVPRFTEVDLKICPFGLGVRNICLDPYFSAAADMKYHKPGDAIYIPRLVGAVMPNGEVHDGFIVIRDSGGAILGEGRFDFFTGFLDHKQRQNTFARLGLGEPKNRFEFRKATEEEARLARERRNFPGLLPEILLQGQL